MSAPTDSGVIRIEIDGTPPSLNKWARLHWTKQRKIKTEWAWLVLAAAMQARIGRPKLKEATVHITYLFKTKRRRDHDNATPKFLMDALVGAGILQDDRSDWIKLTWDFGSGPKNKTIIVIWEGFELGNAGTVQPGGPGGTAGEDRG